MALGTIAAGDRPARRLSRTTKGRRDVCDLFCARFGSGYDETRAGFKTVRFWQIVLQKSQNAVRLNLRSTTKQAATVDRCSLKRATEVASEFVTK